MDNTKIPFAAYKGTDPYIFVSYAHKDSDKVFPIISEFHKAGFPVWYDEGIDPGNEWPQEIAGALLNCSLFIVFISTSAAESKNVVREINYALSKDKPFIHIWLEDAALNPGLEMQITSNQGIMHFRMEPENFYRKCRQSFDAFGIKKAKARAEETRTVAGSKTEVPAGDSSAEFFAKRAGSYIMKKDYDKAIADLNEAIRMDPLNAFYFCQRGYSYHQKKDYDKAIADFNEAIRMDPFNALYFFDRGRSYGWKDEDDKAIADYNEAIRIDPSKGLYFGSRAMVYGFKGDYKNAVADYKEAVRLEPDDDFYKEKLKEAQKKAGG
jgi:tetratricopeptide (TPR) repeat protein